MSQELATITMQFSWHDTKTFRILFLNIKLKSIRSEQTS